VKTNVGHLEAAAGIAGLIKVVLSLQHGQIPPHLHLRTINPHIALDESRIIIPTELTPWPSGERPRIAGVSSFGASGTNAHVVLAESPPTKPSTVVDKRPAHLLSLSAKSGDALNDLASRFREHLLAKNEERLGDVCYTANTGRSHFKHRLAVCGGTARELADRLTAFGREEGTAGLVSGRVERGRSGGVVFLFSGQGSQYAGMGRELYETEPTFRETLERCEEVLRGYLERPLLSVMYPEGDVGSSSELDETGYTQPALFSIGYGLAQMWRSWGVEPSAVMGHSVGEYVAACVAGVFGLEEGLRLIAERGRLMQSLPREGGMAAVGAEASLVESALSSYSGRLSIAAINGPKSVVISGNLEALGEVTAELSSQGIETKRLRVSHAFHSPLMEPILEPFEKVAAEVNYGKPAIPLVSNITGKMVGGESALSSSYWRRHVREAVLFSSSMSTLEEQGYGVFLEVGPGTTLLGMGRECVSSVESSWLPSLRKGRGEWQQVLESVSSLYVGGVELNWESFEGGNERRRVVLPTYPFQRKRYWKAPAASEGKRKFESRPAEGETEVVRLLERGETEELSERLLRGGALEGAEAGVVRRVLEELSRRHREERRGSWVEESLYRVEWEGKPRGVSGGEGGDLRGSWLLLMDEGGFGARVAERIESRGGRAVCVKLGEVEGEPWEALWYGSRLRELEKPVRGVVHFWGLDVRESEEETTLSELEERIRIGCGSLLGVVQALAKSEEWLQGRLWVVTRGGVVFGETGTGGWLSQSPLWGLGKVVGLEHPEIWGGLLDFGAGGDEEVSQLMSELEDSQGEGEILYRGAERYVARLVRGEVEERKPYAFRVDGTYLITGGYGGLGLEVARWMAREGAGHLVLVGRRGAWTEASRAGVEELKRLGAEVLEAKADVSSASDMERVLEEIAASHPPLRGVVHAAGVLSDGILLHQEWERFERVLTPKVQGSWNLHVLTRELDLDFFVLFSSMASVWGSPGQGNYASANAFLDALAHYRKAKRLPGSSINWGPWSGGGMASREEVADSLNRRGVDLMDRERGLAALGRLLQSSEPQRGVISLDWSKLASQLGPGNIPPLLRHFLQEGSSTGGGASPSRAEPMKLARVGDTSALLIDADAPPERRREIIVGRVEADVENVMGAPVRRTDQPLIEAGLDSLMAVQVSNRIEASFGVGGLTRSLLAGASVDDVVDAVERGLETREKAGASQAVGFDEMEPGEARKILANIDSLSDDEVQLLLKTAAVKSKSGHEEPF